MFLAGRLRTIRLREQEKLTESNLELFKVITTYIQSSNIGNSEKEEILQQIMDMMLEAQIENKDIDLIIGKDHEKFCESILEEYFKGKPKLYRILNFIQINLLSVTIALMLVNIWFRNIDITLIVITTIWTFLMYPLFTRRKRLMVFSSLNNKKDYKASYFALTTILALIALFALIICVPGSVKCLFGDKIYNLRLNIFNNLYILLPIVLILLCIQIYKKSYDKQ